MVLASRPYSEKMYELLSHVASVTPEEEAPHPLLQRRPINRAALIMITSNRGLCGGLNSNIIRQVASYLLERERPVDLVTVGRKGRDWMARHGQSIIADFSQLGDRPTLVDTRPIASLIIEGFVAGEFDEVQLFYTQFVSTLIQRPVTRQILPIEPSPKIERRYLEYIYEPDPQAVLAHLLPRFVEVQVYQAVLEAIASEHSARMVAMRNATENAHEMVAELTLIYNRTRQATITKEIIEIVSGAEALR